MEVVEQSEVVDTQVQDSTLGTFKDVQALKTAYDNLRSEFTKKSQALAELRKSMEGDKVATPPKDIQNGIPTKSENNTGNEDELSTISDTTSVGTMHIDAKNAVKNESFDKNDDNVNKNEVLELDKEYSDEGVPFWQKSDWDTQVKEFIEQFDMDISQRKELARILSEDKDLEYAESPLYIAYARMMKKGKIDIDKLMEDENFVESKILGNEKIKSRKKDPCGRLVFLFSHCRADGRAECFCVLVCR